ncbi:MAG: hypothetical protein CMG04_05940 [Candidatus Marinimicrobia bacterium]|mgnify:FL=1|nr:hypothetical protein [Candidatus Neomarinimicrobiota bacterium]|tara:strand:+ start:1323 stop:1523 length:201 start_codon:yes stop_codon:yes gene_type:complete
MKYIKYIKDVSFLIVIVYLLTVVNDNVNLIEQLRFENEQNKENLYQTNLVIEAMQKIWKDNLVITS